ncbi:PE-PGRS family protein [Rhizobium sp. BR 362]|uniref:PE-PGRS family protein n=1 Tax=Rhizobium sp. BR 362 TaxID=3040670 RepID=UPI002F3F5688
MPIPQITDTINLSDPSGGNANAGNGGDGFGNGDIHYNPSAYISNYQDVYGASTDLHNGDHVHQMADWDAGGGGSGGFAQAYNATLAALTATGGAGGDATSNGSQGSVSGGDVAAVSAATTATQTTQSFVDQHATIVSGAGGNGGSGNFAQGGDVSTALVHTDTISTAVSNAFDHFDNTLGSIDVHHLGT